MSTVMERMNTDTRGPLGTYGCVRRVIDGMVIVCVCVFLELFICW